MEGTVTYGPLCPVEPCSQKPSYDFDIIALRDGQEISKARPDQNGRYQLLLSPGTYELQSSRSFAPGTPYTVTVEDGKLTRSDLLFDTGIR